MRLLIDANVFLDCLILERSGEPRSGKASSELVLNLCDSRAHQALAAWHTLPILFYYYAKQTSRERAGQMMDALLQFVRVVAVGHTEACDWRVHGVLDFEDALQVAAAVSGEADVIVTRNIQDYADCAKSVMTPEQFLVAHTVR